MGEHGWTISLQPERHAMQFLPNGFCLLCDDPAGDIPNLCNACIRELPVISNPCITCGAGAVPRTRTCRACAMQHPPVDRTVCALAYAPPVDYLIGRLKFSRDLRAVPVLAGLLDHAVALGATEAEVPDWLVPVPVARSRLRERGFNQALEIARSLGDSNRIRLSRAVHRQRSAETPQSSLPDTSARRANVASAFKVQGTVSGHVTIIDDVVTTGATVNALAQCLKKAGARRVEVWAVARTPDPRVISGRTNQASRLATASAFSSMNSRRGST